LREVLVRAAQSVPDGLAGGLCPGDLLVELVRAGVALLALATWCASLLLLGG